MVKFIEIIKKLLLYDDVIYLQLPKVISEKIIINIKESKSNEKENKNFKIYIKDLSKYFELDNLKIVKFLYYNIKNFHDILYDYDTEIILENEEKNLSYIFYATLLIKDNLNIINYSFTIEFIRGINNIIDKKNDKIYLKLLLSKIIFELIDIYKGLYEYKNNVNEIQQIETNNTNIIGNLIQDINNELPLNFDLIYIKSKAVEQIYIDIIIGLLKNKFEDYNYIYNAIKEMDLESINITKRMFEEVKKFLDDQKSEMINKYLISKPEDLLNENKISFSFILLRFILKSPTFIYQIKFFLKVRNNLLELFSSNPNIFFKQQNIDKLKYILEVVFNSGYYINIYKIKDNNLKEDKSSNKSTEIDADSNSQNIKTSKIYGKTDIVNDTINSNNESLMDSTNKNKSENDKNKNIQNFINKSNENNNKSNKIVSRKTKLNEQNKNSQNINGNKKEINRKEKSKIMKKLIMV